MHSIQKKVSILTVSAILISVIAIGTIVLFSVRREGVRNSRAQMTLLCDNRRKSIDEYIKSIEQSVNMVARYAGENMDDIRLLDGGVLGMGGMEAEDQDRDWDSAQQLELDRYISDYTRNILSVIKSVANHTKGIISYYFQISPEISRKEHGFFYTRIGYQSFTEGEMYQPVAESESDEEYAVWYYEPLHRGRPLWLIPYYNANDHTKVFSYVVPIFVSGTFIGVIGMDIDFATMISQLDDVVIYQTGYLCLTDLEGNIIYHPKLGEGGKLEEFNEALAKALQEKQGNVPVFAEYIYNGTAKNAACSVLANDLVLLLIAPESEINATWIKMLWNIAVAACLIMGGFILVNTLMTKSIIAPLTGLTQASQEVVRGNYDIKLAYDKNDEIGVLTRSFQQLVDHLKVYISDLNSKAYVDALTCVKNKGAFDISAVMLDDQIRMQSLESLPVFGIVMFDCNDLKDINDTYGHEKGDIYLRNACRSICEVFSHSPVFRLGGDEFAAILQGGDYDHRRELIGRLVDLQERSKEQAKHPWEIVSLSKGLAIFDPETDTDTQSVLKRADRLMYEDKERFYASHPQYKKEISGITYVRIHKDA